MLRKTWGGGQRLSERRTEPGRLGPRVGGGQGGPEGRREGRRRAGELEPAGGGSPGEPRRECGLHGSAGLSQR